ncbi:hypothetical protein VPH35_125194 [Triticum aestivum]
MASDRLAAIKAFDETNAGVKGLVDAGVTAVPAFFRHPPDPLSQSACPDAAAIPVVDLSGSRSEVVGAVRAAAQAAGFFQLVNHGVPEAAMWRMLAAGRRFNEEPPEAKAPYYTRDAARRVRYNCNADLFRTLLGKWRDTIYMEDMDKEKDDEELLPPALRGAAPDTRRRFGRWGASSLGCSLRPWGCGAGTCLPGGGGRLPGGTQRVRPLLPGVPGAAPDAERPRLPHRAAPGRRRRPPGARGRRRRRARCVVRRAGDARGAAGERRRLPAAGVQRQVQERRAPRGVQERGAKSVGGVILQGERREGVRPGGRRRGWPAVLQERHGGGAAPLVHCADARRFEALARKPASGCSLDRMLARAFGAR